MSQIYKPVTAGQIGAINAVNVQVFTTIGPGTYTPTSGMKYAIVEIQGGGGGSGGTAGTASQTAASGAGGGGGYLKFLVTAAQIGAASVISVGDGGAGGASGNNAGSVGQTTSFIVAATFWEAAGGDPGQGAAATASAGTSSSSGGGGTFTTGAVGTLIVGIRGATGSQGTFAASGSPPYIAAFGGNSFLGTAQFYTPSSGSDYGTGGSGILNSIGLNSPGEKGGQGIIIVTEFISS